MFVTLATRDAKGYRGFDRDCAIYTGAKIGAFGKVASEADAAWNAYVDLLGVFPIVCTDAVLTIMRRILSLTPSNADLMEIVYFTNDLQEHTPKNARFLGYDAASAAFASVLSGEACLSVPERYTAGRLNANGLFDELPGAKRLAEYANSLGAPDIEPDYPYSAVKVYLAL